MGNRVLNLGRTDRETVRSLEVYRDISMVSKLKGDKLNDEKNMWLQKDVNVKAVFNSLRNIFTWIPGERILLPDFGSRLRMYLYEQITSYNVEQIVAEIRNVCLKYEPRVNIIEVVNASTIEDTEDNIVRLGIIFTIPELGDEQYNYTYICNTTE